MERLFEAIARALDDGPVPHRQMRLTSMRLVEGKAEGDASHLPHGVAETLVMHELNRPMRIFMWFLAAILSVFFLIGLGMLGYGLVSAQRSLQAGSWPTVPGTVEECELSQRSDGEGGRRYIVKAKYRYEVAGKAYAGERIAYGYSASGRREGHADLLKRLEKCEAVDVRYDPAAPENSVLSFGMHRSIWFTLIFAITWLAFVSGFGLLWWLSMGQDNVLLRNLMTY